MKKYTDKALDGMNLERGHSKKEELEGLIQKVLHVNTNGSASLGGNIRIKRKKHNQGRSESCITIREAKKARIQDQDEQRLKDYWKARRDSQETSNDKVLSKSALDKNPYVSEVGIKH
jgi:hypothetical protein